MYIFILFLINVSAEKCSNGLYFLIIDWLQRTRLYCNIDLLHFVIFFIKMSPFPTSFSPRDNPLTRAWLTTETEEIEL